MKKSELEERIKTVLMMHIPLNDINSSSSLRDDFGIDSLGLVSLILELEEALDITLETSDLSPDELKTVGDLNKVLEKYFDID